MLCERWVDRTALALAAPPDLWPLVQYVARDAVASKGRRKIYRFSCGSVSCRKLFLSTSGRRGKALFTHQEKLLPWIGLPWLFLLLLLLYFFAGSSRPTVIWPWLCLVDGRTWLGKRTRAWKARWYGWPGHRVVLAKAWLWSWLAWVQSLCCLHAARQNLTVWSRNAWLLAECKAMTFWFFLWTYWIMTVTPVPRIPLWIILDILMSWSTTLEDRSELLLKRQKRRWIKLCWI